MDLVTLDFETYYDRDYSLSKMTVEEYVRDSRFEAIGVAVKHNDKRPIWFSGYPDQMGDFLNSLNLQDKHLLGHNTMFDGAILAWHFGIKPKYYLDTLSMSRPVAGPKDSGGLASLSQKFKVGVKGNEVVTALGKRRRQFTPEELDKYGEYCINDVELTYRLFQVIKQFSTPREMYVIDLFIRMFTDPVLVLDREVLTSHLKSLNSRQREFLDSMGVNHEEARRVLMSNNLLAGALKRLGVDPPTKVSPRTGKTTYAFSKTDPEFKALLDHADIDVQALVSARIGVKSTLELTRTERFIGISERGPLPVPLTYYAAHTGRAGGSDRINLQNLTRGSPLRAAITAPKGHMIIASDQSQIEARMVATLAGQGDLVQAFRDKLDVYSLFASEVYGFEVKKELHPKERFVGKTCILGLGYGMGKEKYQTTLSSGKPPIEIDLDESARIVTLYRNKYANIPLLWSKGDEVLDSILRGVHSNFGIGITLPVTDEGIVLPNGMLIRYPDLRRTKEGYTYSTRNGPVNIYGAKVVENVSQALSRIVMFDQMCVIDQFLKAYDSDTKRYKTVLTVHDEDVVVCPEDDVERVAAHIDNVMSKPPKWALDLPVACEVKFGKSYADCK